MTESQMQQAALAACKLIASGEMAYFEAITSQFAPLCDSRLDHAKIAAALGSEPRALTVDEIARLHAMGSPIGDPVTQHKEHHEIHQQVNDCGYGGGCNVPADQDASTPRHTPPAVQVGSGSGEVPADAAVIRKTVWLRKCTDAPTIFVSTLWSAYEDGHELAGIGIPIPIISRDGGKTWHHDDTAKDAEIARLAAERDAAVKRAEDAEFSQAAMQEVITTVIKAFSGIDVLIRNGDEDGIVQRFADAGKAMDAVVGRPSEAASAIRARLATAVDALNEIIGHGYTWPSTDPKSEDWRQGYSRGVSSVKSIARQALAAIDAAKEAK